MKSNEKNSKYSVTFSEKLKGYFILTRPAQLIWLDIFVALSIYAVIAQQMPNVHYLLFIICAVLADAGACTINDLGDLESDRLSTESSRKDRPLPRGIISSQEAKYQALLLFIIGLGVALYLDIYVFIIAFILIIISYQYSMNPLKLDARPVVSQLFWVTFGILYYFAVAAYLIRYEDVSWDNIYTGLYFLSTMLLFSCVGHTLAKDLRDLDNDKAGGKNTTPVHFGSRKTVVTSFAFSFTGLLFWAVPFFTFYETHIFYQIVILCIVVIWNIICFHLTRSIYRKYTKDNARRLHQGFILTFTFILATTFFIGII